MNESKCLQQLHTFIGEMKGSRLCEHQRAAAAVAAAVGLIEYRYPSIETFELSWQNNKDGVLFPNIKIEMQRKSP